MPCLCCLIIACCMMAGAQRPPGPQATHANSAIYSSVTVNINHSDYRLNNAVAQCRTSGGGRGPAMCELCCLQLLILTMLHNACTAGGGRGAAGGQRPAEPQAAGGCGQAGSQRASRRRQGAQAARRGRGSCRRTTGEGGTQPRKVSAGTADCFMPTTLLSCYAFNLCCCRIVRLPSAAAPREQTKEEAANHARSQQ